MTKSKNLTESKNFPSCESKPEAIPLFFTKDKIIIDVGNGDIIKVPDGSTWFITSDSEGLWASDDKAEKSQLFNQIVVGDKTYVEFSNGNMSLPINSSLWRKSDDEPDYSERKYEKIWGLPNNIFHKNSKIQLKPGTKIRNKERNVK